MPVTVKVEQGNAVIRGLRLSGSDRAELMENIGLGQLQSVYRTFADEGPGWAPLSPASLRWGKYTPGHKLLIGSGRLRNSIRSSVSGNTVTIGTNVAYARVQQEGFHGTQSVKEYSYARKSAAGDKFAKSQIRNKLGRKQTVTRKTVGGVTFVTVKAHKRNLNIPARPFLVFRPEDPARIGQQIAEFYRQRSVA